MTTYLLDANVFIQAKRNHYGLDFCPAFWEWLILQHRGGQVFSVEKIGEELAAGGDELSTWAAARGAAFFLPPDAKHMASLALLAQWVRSQHYTPAAVSAFLDDADYYLVGYAHAHEFIVVTHEQPSSGPNEVKIPNACVTMNVKYLTTFEMLRRERARFVLPSGGAR